MANRHAQMIVTALAAMLIGIWVSLPALARADRPQIGIVEHHSSAQADIQTWKVCTTLKAPLPSQHKCSRRSSSSPNGRPRSDDAEQAAPSSLAALIDLGWPKVTQLANLNGNRLLQNGSRAPFWHFFAATTQMRN